MKSLRILTIIIILLIISTLVASSLIPRNVAISNIERIDSDLTADDFVMYRLHDDQKNVTCWIATSGEMFTSITMSCLSDSQFINNSMK